MSESEDAASNATEVFASMVQDGGDDDGVRGKRLMDMQDHVLDNIFAYVVHAIGGRCIVFDHGYSNGFEEHWWILGLRLINRRCTALCVKILMEMRAYSSFHDTLLMWQCRTCDHACHCSCYITDTEENTFDESVFATDFHRLVDSQTKSAPLFGFARVMQSLSCRLSSDAIRFYIVDMKCRVKIQDIAVACGEECAQWALTTGILRNVFNNQNGSCVAVGIYLRDAAMIRRCPVDTAEIVGVERKDRAMHYISLLNHALEACNCRSNKHYRRKFPIPDTENVALAVLDAAKRAALVSVEDISDVAFNENVSVYFWLGRQLKTKKNKRMFDFMNMVHDVQTM
jgi:hypothetical protein